jgi:hypothetical protein
VEILVDNSNVKRIGNKYTVSLIPFFFFSFFLVLLLQIFVVSYRNLNPVRVFFFSSFWLGPCMTWICFIVSNIRIKYPMSVLQDTL